MFKLILKYVIKRILNLRRLVIETDLDVKDHSYDKSVVN